MVEGANIVGDPTEATTARGDTRCLLCSQVVDAKAVRQMGQTSGFGEVLTAVVTTMPGKSGKHYRSPIEGDLQGVRAANRTLNSMQNDHGEVSAIPDEPINPETLGLRINAMGFRNWSQLFNDRQSVALATFSKLVKVAFDEMLNQEIESDYARALCGYLSLAVGRLAARNSNQCIYNVARETIENEIARGALPPVWDYAEAAPIFDSTGSWTSCLSGMANVIEACVVDKSVPDVTVRDATGSDARNLQSKAVITDPPYYNSVDYAGLSDFFYVWLKRSLGPVDPSLFPLPLTPKTRQAIMDSESRNNAESRERYVTLMKSALSNVHLVHPADQIAGVAFANRDPDAWATLIESLLDVGLVPRASWPIDTEMQSGMVKMGQARLSTSVWMACRKREEVAGDAFLGDVLEAMRNVIRERLLYFWSKGIRGSDFFISAIGPALSVFGRYDRVLRPDGTAVTVLDFLDIVRRESTTVALEQVLQGADLGVIDPVTRQYVTWVWSYSRSPLDAGEAIALSLATGAPYVDTVQPGSIAVEDKSKSKKLARLRTIRQRASEDDDLGQDTSARPAPLIDKLQCAAWLWGQNRTGDLGSYRGSLGETRWEALRTLGQAVAGCLPDGDEDRRIILGLLGSNVMAPAAPANSAARSSQPAGAQLPGFETEEK